MIVLKILLWIILAVLGVILLVLIVPVSGRLSYIGGKPEYDVRFFFMKVLSSDGSGMGRKLIQRFRRRKKPKPGVFDDTDYFDDVDDFDYEDVGDPNIDFYKEKDEEEEPGAAKETAAEKEEAHEEKPEEEKPRDFEPFHAFRKPREFEKHERFWTPEDDRDSIFSKIEFLFTIWDIADRPLLKIFKGIKFSDTYIDFAVAGSDAFKCALNYGAVSGGVYNILAWLAAVFTVKYRTVDVFPDFEAEESRFDVSVKVSTTCMNIFVAVIWFAIMYIFKIFIPNKLEAKKKAKKAKKSKNKK